jgi:acetoin:2,6-dichlorophenolindophenol oxidoreductase subunit alpha
VEHEAEHPSEPSASDLALLLSIRHFELALLDAFSRGRLHGTTHTCVGQEYIPVALKPMLGTRDFVFSNHRGHGHYLARFDDPAGLLAEIMGREGAVCAGVGGSQHIYRDGSYMSTGVQGESMPVATGVALHFKRHRQGALAVAHIGDGTWGQGAVYESLNMAQLWRLPLLVVVENNGIAQTTPTSLQLAGSIAGRAAAFGVAVRRITSVDVGRIRDELRGPLEEARAGGGPLVVEFETTRIGPHSKGDDTRDVAELARLRARDWYAVYRERFPDQFEAADARAAARIAEVMRDVEARPPSTWRAS